jgi:small subunit ribosomal protein S1
MVEERELAEGEVVSEGHEPELGGEVAETAPEAGEAVELDQTEMERLYEDSMKHIREGEIVSGKIVRIEKDTVLVDIGYKSEGAISLHEFDDAGKNLQVGDMVDVFLDNKEDNDGFVVLSKEKANRIKLWDEIEKIYESDGVVEGTVVDKTRGGLTVDIGLKAFLPGSQGRFAIWRGLSASSFR